MSLHKNCGWWKNSDCIFEFSVKSYVTNTINLSCANILLPSVIQPVTVRHLNLSETRSIQSTPCHLTALGPLILSCLLLLDLPNGLFPSRFPTKILYAFHLSPHVLHAPLVSIFFIWSSELQATRWEAQNTKFLIMQFTPVSCYFVRLTPKYLPRHPILEYPPSLKYLSYRVPVHSYPHSYNTLNFHQHNDLPSSHSVNTRHSKVSTLILLMIWYDIIWYMIWYIC